MTLSKVHQAQRRYESAASKHRDAREHLREVVLQARETHSLTEIGKALGMTKQGVYGLLNEGPR